MQLVGDSGLKIRTVWVRIPSWVPKFKECLPQNLIKILLKIKLKSAFCFNIGGWCNGNTTDFDSVVSGSSPGPSAKRRSFQDSASE